MKLTRGEVKRDDKIPSLMIVVVSSQRSLSWVGRGRKEARYTSNGTGKTRVDACRYSSAGSSSVIMQSPRQMRASQCVLPVDAGCRATCLAPVLLLEFQESRSAATLDIG